MLMSIPAGARYMILSALGFAFMGMFVKLAYADGIPVLEIVAARSLVSALLSYADVRRKRIALLGKRRGLLLARGGIGALALMCVYYSVVNIPYATATVLQYLHPMFTAVLAAIFLKERLQFSTLTCVILSLIGLMILVSPNLITASVLSYSPLAIGAAITGALGSAIAYILVRKLSQTEDPSVIIFYFPAIALPLSLLWLGSDLILPTGWTWLTLLGVGVATQIGQIGLTKALQVETAARATSFSYLQVVFAAIIGWIVFAEIPVTTTLIGGSCIIAAALLNLFWKIPSNTVRL